MPEWLFTIVSVLLPAAVGVTMFGAFEWWDRARRRGRGAAGLPIIDYSI